MSTCSPELFEKMKEFNQQKPLCNWCGKNTVPVEDIACDPCHASLISARVKTNAIEDY